MTKPTVPRAQRVTLSRDFTRSEDFLSEYVLDVSQSGAFIRSNDPLPVGTRLNLRFPVMVEKMEIVEGVGEVVRESAQPRGMGVVFVELTEASQDILARLVTKRGEASAPDGVGGEGALAPAPQRGR